MVVKMIETSKECCPVCLDNNGYGDDPRPLTPSYGENRSIQPCRYPWQTPIGVLIEDVENPQPPEQRINAYVQLSGTFELYYSNENDKNDSDIYGCGEDIGMLGKRVYYDAAHSIYVMQYATNIPDVPTASADEYRGNYPGAATIGYISRVRPAGAGDRGYVTITIDPRPAQAQYRVADFSGDVSTFPPGTPVTILSPDNFALAYSEAIHPTCDGIVAGYYTRPGESSPDQIIVCTAGPAWIFPTQGALYAVCEYDDIIESGFPSQHVPIDANLALAPSNGADVPRVGYAHMTEWYHYTLDSDIFRMLIDVDLEAPTIVDLDTNRNAPDGVTVEK